MDRLQRKRSVQFSLSEPLDADLVLPQSAVLEDSSLDFVTVVEGVIPRGSLSADIPVEQGFPRTFEFDSVGIRAQNVYLPRENAKGKLLPADPYQ